MATTAAGPRSKRYEWAVLLVTLIGWLAIGCVSSNETSESSVADSVSRSDTALSIEYDRFDDWTTVSTPWVPGSQASIMADYSCSGEPGCIPATVWLRVDLHDRLIPDERYDNPFDEVSSGWSPEGTEDEDWYAAVVFLLDGETRIREGIATTDGYYANIQLPIAQFRELVAADTVEFRVLNVEGALSGEQQEVLERTLKVMASSKG